MLIGCLNLGVSPQMALFPLTTGSPTGKWVTVPMLRIIVRRAAHLAGLSAFGYTPHSLRRGGASFSYLAGVPVDHIRISRDVDLHCRGGLFGLATQI